MRLLHSHHTWHARSALSDDAARATCYGCGCRQAGRMRGSCHPTMPIDTAPSWRSRSRRSALSGRAALRAADAVRLKELMCSMFEPLPWSIGGARAPIASLEPRGRRRQVGRASTAGSARAHGKRFLMFFPFPPTSFFITDHASPRAAFLSGASTALSAAIRSDRRLHHRQIAQLSQMLCLLASAAVRIRLTSHTLACQHHSSAVYDCRPCAISTPPLQISVFEWVEVGQMQSTAWSRQPWTASAFDS